MDLRLRPATLGDLRDSLRNGKLDGPKLFRVDPKTMSSKPVTEAARQFHRKKCVMREGPFRQGWLLWVRVSFTKLF